MAIAMERVDAAGAFSAGARPWSQSGVRTRVEISKYRDDGNPPAFSRRCARRLRWLPEEQELFDRIRDALTAVEPRGGEGSFAASTAAMSDEQAVAVARDIAELRVWMTLRSDM